MGVDRDRRRLLQGAAAMAALGAAGVHPLSAGAAPEGAQAAEARDGFGFAPPPNRKRVYRIAHVTDIHVKPETRADEGMIAALRHVHALADAPDVIFQGGDLIMSAMNATRERTKVQFDLAMKILADENRLPIEHCLGNHDIWGIGGSAESGKPGDEGYGKAWAMDLLGLEKPYRSFDRAGWHFVVLDSVQFRAQGGYRPLLDPDQHEWLEADLAAVPTEVPVLVFSHVPIISVGSFFFGKDTEKENQWRIISALMMLDARRLKDLFHKHPNVKVCISGHIHLRDLIVYDGVTYIGTGAVSGSWWGGPMQETPEGYGLVNLYNDGTFDYEYIPFGWKAGRA